MLPHKHRHYRKRISHFNCVQGSPTTLAAWSPIWSSIVLSRDIYGPLVPSLHRMHRTGFHGLLFIHGGTLQDEEFSSEATSNPCSLGNSNFIRIGGSYFQTGIF